jgi:diguanylate cyclase (GGDEF)-like protein
VAGNKPGAEANAVAEQRAEIARLERELIDAQWKIAALEARADVDPLLEIFNRRGFERELKRSLAYVARYGIDAALVYLDLDGFKGVNDRHGHAAGDALLKAVAAKLLGSVRGSDVVARLGGDEFAVLLWNLSETQAQAKAWLLEAAIAAAVIDADDAHVAVSASAGVVPLAVDTTTAALIAAADKAMYARKREKR